MAPLAAPGRPAKHHPRGAAVQVPGAEPGREHLAVHARELALEPHLQVLQRPPRPLLCSLEQARRPALAHHDHRPARLGISVLINEAWYKTVGTKLASAATETRDSFGLTGQECLLQHVLRRLARLFA